MAVRQAPWGKARKGKARKEVWIVDFLYVHPSGKRDRVRRKSPVNTKRGAEQYERELRAAILNPPPKVKEVPTFKTFVEKRWLPVYPKAVGNRPSTIREKESHLKLYLKPELGELRLDKIRGEVVDRLFASLRTRGLKPKSIKNVRATLRRILASAVEWEVIDTIPPLPKVKVPESSFDFYTQEESDKLLDAARDEEERALLLFALHTGARAGEQLALEWGDLDWNSRQVTFSRSLVLGKVGHVKSGKVRHVPLTGKLEAALRGIRHLRGKLVFCREDGSAMSVYQLHERLWATSKRAKLRKVRWHDLRHSFASNLVIAGVPIRQVQAWLGHSTITMTMRYSHLAPGGGADLISVLDGDHGSSVAARNGGICKAR